MRTSLFFSSTRSTKSWSPYRWVRGEALIWLEFYAGKRAGGSQIFCEETVPGGKEGESGWREELKTEASFSCKWWWFRGCVVVLMRRAVPVRRPELPPRACTRKWVAAEVCIGLVALLVTERENYSFSREGLFSRRLTAWKKKKDLDSWMSRKKRRDVRRGLRTECYSEYESPMDSVETLLLRRCSLPHYNEAGMWFEARWQWCKFWHNF